MEESVIIETIMITINSCVGLMKHFTGGGSYAKPLCDRMLWGYLILAWTKSLLYNKSAIIYLKVLCYALL